MSKLQSLEYLFRLFRSPYLIGFYRGHVHLSEEQVTILRDILSSHDNELIAQVVGNYEARFGDLVGNGFCQSFASGRMAFFSLMQSLGIGPGDEVIIPGFTCSVVPNAIIRTGARPVYSDIDCSTLGSDASAIERCITPRTKMIVAQHSFGIPCNIDAIVDLAKSKGIFLVEDSALALDSRLQGKPVGTWGDAAFFSSDHSKPLNTIIGGMLYTPHKDIFDNVKRTLGDIPDLSEEHQKNLFQRFEFERKYYTPSNFPRAIIREILHDSLKKLVDKPSVFLEGDYTADTSSSPRYPYPAKMPAFLAQLGLFEIDRWADEKKERKASLRDYLTCSEIARDIIQIPDAYYDTKREIIPLRFIFRSTHARELRKAFERYFDTKAFWFLDPVVCCTHGSSTMGYRNGNCVISERVCSDILNMPCVLPEGWDKRTVSIFHDILSGNK